MADREAFLKLARARWKSGTEADEAQRKREIAAIRFYNGEQWDADLLKSRQGDTIGSGTTQQIVPARPSLTINRTREPVRQVLNQERQSEMGIELVPADDWGDTTGQVNHDEIKVREGIIRRIQRDSEACDARSWAFERAVISGRGYYLVLTRYAPGKTRNQEVYVHKIYNQNSVVVDPAHEESDGSDVEWFFTGNDNISWDQYVADYGLRNGKKNRVVEAKADSDWRALGEEAPDWFVTDSTSENRYVRIVDYYYTDYSSRVLCEMKDGSDVWESELPADIDEGLIERRRNVVDKKFKWAKIDGCNDDVLEETDLQGHYLGLVKVVGEELQPTDNERRSEGIVEPMMDSCRGFNYTASKFVERVALTTIPPIMMAGGQDETYEAEWDAITTRTLGRVHYNQKDSFGQPAPPPARSPNSSSDVADLGAGLNMFSEAIVSTSRVPETAMGHIDPSVKSGKLANALIQQSNQGSSNYLDNLRRSIRHEARIINDLLYPIYGTPGRVLRMMDPSGKMSQVLHAGSLQRQMPGQPPLPLPTAQNQMPTVELTPDAEFNVAVKVSKASNTRREEIFRNLMELAGNSPEQMGIIGDLVWKFSDAPEHEELEKRYKAMLLPQVQAAINGGPQQLPPQAQQQMQQMQAEIQHLRQLADKNATDLQKTQMQEQGDTQRQAASDQASILKTQITAAASEANAQAKVDAENFRSYVDAMEQSIANKLDLHLQHVSQMLEHGHAQASQAKDHAHEVGMAALEHQHALEQGQQAAQVASAQMNQQAALQPAEGE